MPSVHELHSIPSQGQASRGICIGEQQKGPAEIASQALLDCLGGGDPVSAQLEAPDIPPADEKAKVAVDSPTRSAASHRVIRAAKLGRADHSPSTPYDTAAGSPR